MNFNWFILKNKKKNNNIMKKENDWKLFPIKLQGYKKEKYCGWNNR